MTADQSQAPTATLVDLGAIFISLELSKSTWLVTALSPCSEKMSRHTVAGGDLIGLFECFAALRQKAKRRKDRLYPLVVIQEAGLDGFWLGRVLDKETWIESHIVEAGSIAMPRRHRRAKTDRLDGEPLIRALIAWKRGEPRACSMVKLLSPEEEDNRRIGRERKTLIAERGFHVNRIKGLLFTQGIREYEPVNRDRRQRLDELRTGDGRPLSKHLKAEVYRELDRLELILTQIKAVAAERDALIVQETPETPKDAAALLGIRGIGPEFATILYTEGLFRHFDNRRQIASYAGLAPSPRQSGNVNREQGVSKAGNPRPRAIMVELAWLWLRHQPTSTLSCWFKKRIAQNGGRLKKPMIVALARKLLVALWKYVSSGVVIEGAIMKTP
ncbi:IS110 family transposase [Agrobacterium radiobacter]|uniref:IS110 family transposase n=1 Tax=Agrobacterium radiobacter TaxID=362 RepID=UPI000761081E|nr:MULTISPECIES: IS110 family transposase [Agrobacterium tumefaciens complex]KAB0458969.1 IS110 family transposase [Agrobacterium tumefaciens]KWT79213.1 transposase [Agrobacterium radiobacter]NIB11355.1 IS110 family transposase [Agrobacterium radiobacter]OOO31074.1 IS110 family transposase [Agrobacterium radiobacter]